MFQTFFQSSAPSLSQCGPALGWKFVEEGAGRAVLFPLAFCGQHLLPSLQSWSEGGRSKGQEISIWLAQIQPLGPHGVLDPQCCFFC